jgi:tetratricopeptide (TPR) repeat protein
MEIRDSRKIANRRKGRKMTIQRKDAPRISLVFFLILMFSAAAAQLPAVQEGYWTPQDPPKAHYVIDARIDFGKKALEGKETIEFRNGSRGQISIIAIDWSIGPESSLTVSAAGKILAPLNPKNVATLPSPVLFRLPDPLSPGKRLKLDVAFRRTTVLEADSQSFVTSRFYPSLWWDGLPTHDSFSVKIDIPQGYAVAATGRLSPRTGRHETAGARTFGIFLGKDMKAESREVEGVLVTTIATAKGAKAAAICLDTACDVIKFAKAWLGFYPFPCLTIIPGSAGRWGGYPVASGIVAIHGQETYRDGEAPLWWKWITAHEIGHQYWGEWVLDPDNPAWLWIAMGITLDTEYLTTQKIDPGRRAKWMGNYLGGVLSYYDMTVDIPPAQVEKIRYDHNNTVIHSKCPSMIFALDGLLGRPMFERIYKRCLTEYGGKRLGWRDFERVCEQETGQSLVWFFDQWVRSNAYLCYKVEAAESRPEGAGYISNVTVRRLGTMKMPIPVRAEFEDGSSETKSTERSLETDVLTFASRSKLKGAVIDPEKKLAMLDEPLPPISEDAARTLAYGWSEKDCVGVYQAIKAERIANSDTWYRLGTQLFGRDQYEASADCFGRVAALEKDGLDKFAALGWLGLLSDLRGKRTEALAHYREALKYDTGESMRHDQFRITMNKKWLEERLKTPFSRYSAVAIPAKPTAGELVDIVDGLNWTGQGKTPALVYEKTRGLAISDAQFWLKLGLLLFDSGYYQQSFSAFEMIPSLESSALLKFTAHVWMGQLMDLLGKREKALEYYRAALKEDPGTAMQHSQYGLKLDRSWVEERLKTPFAWKK